MLGWEPDPMERMIILPSCLVGWEPDPMELQGNCKLGKESFVSARYKRFVIRVTSCLISMSSILILT